MIAAASSGLSPPSTPWSSYARVTFCAALKACRDWAPWLVAIERVATARDEREPHDSEHDAELLQSSVHDVDPSYVILWFLAGLSVGDAPWWGQGP